MKNTNKKKFASILIIVLILSLMAPSVFAAKPAVTGQSNKPTKPTITYVLSSITGGGSFVSGTSKYSFGFNIHKSKDGKSAINLTFVDAGTTDSESDNTIIKVRGTTTAAFPVFTSSTRKISTSELIFANVSAKIKIGDTGTWDSTKTATLTIKADNLAKTDKLVLTIDGTSTTYTLTPINGNIVAHYRRVKNYQS